MKKNELIQLIKECLLEISVDDNISGITVYHGTSSKYIINILKLGLLPKPNKYMIKYVVGADNRRNALKELPKELYVTQDFDSALSFAEDSSYYGGTPIVLSFIVDKNDEIIEKNVHFSDEYIINNKILPTRLKIEYPENFNISKYNSILDEKTQKTNKIKKANLILKKHNILIRSGSKTTDRLVFYYIDNGDFIFKGTFKLSDFINLNNGIKIKASESDRESLDDFSKLIASLNQVELSSLLSALK